MSNGYDKCPICKKLFKSDDCKHSVTDVEEHLREVRIRFIVRDELKKVLKELGIK